MPSHTIIKGFSTFCFGCMLLGCQNKSTCSKTLSDLSSLDLAESVDFQSGYLMGILIFQNKQNSHRSCQALFKMDVNNDDRKAQVQIFTSRKCLTPYPESGSSTADIWVLPFVDSDDSAPADKLKGNGYLSITAFSQDLHELAKKRSAHFSKTGDDSNLKAKEEDLATDMMKSLWQATPEAAFAHLDKPENMTSEVKDYLRYIHTSICSEDVKDHSNDSMTKAQSDFKTLLNKIKSRTQSLGFGCYSALDLTMFTATADISKGGLSRLQKSAKVIPIQDQSKASAWHRFLTNERFQRDLDIMSTIADTQQTAKKLLSLATDIKDHLAQVPMVVLNQVGEATPHPSLSVVSNNKITENSIVRGYDSFGLIGSDDENTLFHGYLINQTPWGLTALQRQDLRFMMEDNDIITSGYLYKQALLMAHSVPVGTLQAFHTSTNIDACYISKKIFVCLEEFEPKKSGHYLTYPPDEPEVTADEEEIPLDPNPTTPVRVGDTQNTGGDTNRREPPRTPPQIQPRREPPPWPLVPPVDGSGSGSGGDSERVVYNEDLETKHINRVTLNTSEGESPEEVTNDTPIYVPNYSNTNPPTPPNNTPLSPRSPIQSTSNSSDATADSSDDCTE